MATREPHVGGPQRPMVGSVLLEPPRAAGRPNRVALPPAPAGTYHVCDQTCQCRVFFDNYHTICRVSRRVFPNPPGMQRRMSQKRASEGVAGDADGEGPSQSVRRVPPPAPWQTVMQ